MIDFDLWKKLNTKKYTRLRLRVNPKNPCINRSFQFISVPRVGIEPTLPKELDFESSASTNSAIEAIG